MADRIFFQRVGHVALSDASGTPKPLGSGNNALDFKFRIKKSVNNAICEASIEVYGLNLPTIQRLTYWGTYDLDKLKYRQVQVFAGYADKGEKLIFNGYGARVTPTQPPNAGVIIEAKNNLTYGRTDYSVTVSKTVKFSECVQLVATELGLRENIDADVKDKTISNFHTSGTLEDLINTLKGLADVYVWTTENELRVSNRSQKANTTGTKTKQLDLDHGLLGLNSLTMEGLEARVRLNTEYDCDSWVKLESQLYPKRASGEYRVYEVEHRGHLRGQEWETIIRATNVNHLF